MNLHIPDWLTSVSLYNHGDRWTCTASGDQFRTGKAHTSTASDPDPQKAIYRASNMAGGAQERAVAMGLEVADAVDGQAGVA